METVYQIDVTDVVNRVKEKNLLFYPVIIHIFMKSFFATGHNNIKPAYLNANQDSEFSFLSQEYTPDFEQFFNEYVKNCFYNNQSDCNLENCILFSYVLPAKLNLADKQMPSIYILPLEEEGGRTYLSFCAQNAPVDEAFVSACIKHCDMF